MRDFLEVPVAVENVSSYAEFHVSEMTEWEFLNEVVERADCGILLDVNNIYVSSRNHNFDPVRLRRTAFPPNASPRSTSPGTRSIEKYILDTHDHPVIDPVWKLYERAIRADAALLRPSGMGRPDPFLRGSPRRGAEGQPLCGREGMRLMRSITFSVPWRCHSSAPDADQAMRQRSRDGKSMRAVAERNHQAERPADFLRAARDL